MKYEITQSLIKDVWDMRNPNTKTCGLFFEQRYLKKSPLCSKETESTKRGKYFEEKLIGASRDGTIVIYNTKSNGEKYANQSRLDVFLNDFAKPVFEDLELEFSPEDVQREISFVDDDGYRLVGHTDLTPTFKGQKIIIDIKYTDKELYGQWSHWGVPEDRNNIQDIFYFYVYMMQYKEALPFYYLVFSNHYTNGYQVKLLRPKVKESAIDELMYEIEEVKSFLEDFEPTPVNDFNVCRPCPLFNTCDKKTTKVTVEEYIVDKINKYGNTY